MTTSLKEMPKIELHCHLDGSMRLEVIRKLLMEMGQEYSYDQLKEQLCAPWNCVSLAEYLKCFDLPIQCLQTYHGLEKAAFDLAAQAAEENVKYLEIRFAPSFSTGQGLTIRQILEAVQKGLEKAYKQFGIYSGVIVCGMRNLDMDTNLTMLKEARAFLGDGVVACDLAGDEKGRGDEPRPDIRLCEGHAYFTVKNFSPARPHTGHLPMLRLCCRGMQREVTPTCSFMASSISSSRSRF